MSKPYRTYAYWQFAGYDFSYVASALKSVQLILAKIPAHLVLRQHFRIDTPLQTYHKENEHKAVENVVLRIKSESLWRSFQMQIPRYFDPGFYWCANV